MQLVRVGLLVLALEPAVDREPFDPAAQAAALVGDRAREPAEGQVRVRVLVRVRVRVMVQSGLGFN